MKLIFKSDNVMRLLISLSFVFLMYGERALSADILSNENSIRSSLEKSLRSRGSCVSASEKFSLDEIYFLNGNEIRVPSKSGYYIYTIEAEKIRVELFSKSDVLSESTSFDLEMEINLHNKKEDNLDIDASFLLLNDRPAIFWKETYKNQPHRQGIFRIENDNLVWACEGRGGAYKSH